jgi:hypothetical protein
MKPKILPLLEQCIEHGVRRGYSRAFKHVEVPSKEAICESIETAVMAELYDWFDLD